MQKVVTGVPVGVVLSSGAAVNRPNKVTLLIIFSPFLLLPYKAPFAGRRVDNRKPGNLFALYLDFFDLEFVVTFVIVFAVLFYIAFIGGYPYKRGCI